MNEQNQEQTRGVASANSKSGWVRPELCRFRAGAAELGDVANPDGNVSS